MTVHLVIPARKGLSGALSAVLAASAIALAAAPSASAAEPAPAISVDKQLTQQIDDATADNSVLIGEPVEYTLTVSNARGAAIGRAYNVSVTDVLPVGVGYLAGSSSIGEPKVISDAPAKGQTTLVWSNLFDVSAAGEHAYTYSVTPDPDLLPVGSSFLNDAVAFATNDPFDVPVFGVTGTCQASCDFTARDTQTTLINAIEIRKNEPSPEAELLRGIHGGNSTTYTITVTNNKVHATNGIALSDAIPAGMEFLGCGGVDNTTGGLLEYVGADPLTDIPTIAAPPCRPPVTVDTVDGDPDGTGPAPSALYTNVTWEAFDLAPGATRTFTYRAGIPLYENTATWPNGKPADTSGEQAANLDNNTGSSTAERLSEVTYTNYAVATGEYQGPGVGEVEGPVSVVAENTENVVSEDLAIRKSVSPSTFTIGGTATYTLTARTSEYRDSSDVEIEDTLPDGLTYIPDSAVATLNGAPTTLDVVMDSTVANAVRLGFTAASGSLPAGSTLVITFKASMDATYASGAPTASGDSYVNRVATTGTTDPAVDPLDPPGAGVVEGSLSVADVSSATITSTLPANDKRIGQDRSITDCSAQTYGDAIPTPPFQVGDTICFDLTVRFTPGSSVNNVLSPLVRDFLPTTLRFVPGSETVGPDNTLPVSQIAFSDATAGAAGGSLLWTLGEFDAQATNPGQLVVRPLASGVGAVFQVRFAATVDSTLLDANKELTGNLLKTSGLDSTGDAYTGRDQSDFELAGSQVAISKGVAQINGLPATPFPPNTDNKTVKGGDLVTFRVDVTNVGTSGAGSDVPVRNLTVVDDLPAGLLCATVTAISDAGSCSDAKVPSRITWARVPDEIASTLPGNSKTLTYDVRIPSNVSVNANYINKATVMEYESLTNSSWIANEPVDITDVSNVRTPNAALAKTGVTSLNLPNNNLKTQFTVGEEITYTIQGSIPAGTTALNGVIRDDLPASLEYVSSAASSTIAADAGQSIMPGQSLPSGAALTRSGRTVTLTLPKSVTNDTTSALAYSVTIRAKVLGGSYTHGGGITNTARFSGTGFNVSSQYSAKVVLPNPIIAKSNDATGPVDDTVTITYTLRVTNPSPAAPALPRPTSYDTAVIDCVPAGMSFIDYGATDGATTDAATAGDGANGCAAGTTRIGWSVGAVAANATKTLTYTAKVDAGVAASETFTNVATVRGSTLDNNALDQALEGVYSASSSSQVRTSNGLIEKTVKPTEAAVGETVTWTIATTYQAGLSFYDAIVTDLLPTGVDESTVATTSVTCAPAAACAIVIDPAQNPTFGSEIAPVGRTIGWNVGDVGLTATDVTVTVVYTARVQSGLDLASGDVLTNTATSRWATTNGGSLVPGASATADLTIARPRLGVTKAVETDAPTPGKPYTYTVVVSNGVGDGVSAAYLVEVQDAVPDGVIVDAATISSGGTLSGEGPSGGGVISWLLDGPIAPGASVTLTYDAKLPSSAKSGSFTNVVDIPSYSSFPTHGDPYDDVDPAEATVEVGDTSADLAIVKTPSGSTTPGSTWTFTMAVSNLGPSDAEGPITVVDELPAGMTFLSEGADWTCFPYGQTVYCAYFDDLAADESAPDLQLTVQIAATPTTASYRNVASVESLTEDPSPGNNESSATVTVSPNPVNPGPTDPTDPTNPGGPTDPTDPTNPGGTVDPGNPGGSVVVQKPTQPLPLPDKVEPSRPTVVLPGGIDSNAGQPVRATVECRPLLRYTDKVALALDGSWIPLGDTAYCTVKERTSGEVSVTVNYPGPVLVKVTYSAPKVPGYTAYRQVKRYVVVPF